MKTLISEPITPLDLAMSSVPGEPGRPTRFTWRGQTYSVTQVLEAWKGIGADRTHGSGELYLHKHCFASRPTPMKS